MKISNMGFTVFVLLYCILVIMASDPSLHDAENLEKLTQANNEFALNLYHNLADGKSDNIFFSPVSITQLLAMLLYGATGQTAKEISRVLGYEKVNLPYEEVPRTFHHLLTDVYSRNMSSGYILETANFILVDNHYKVIPDYKSKVENYYSAVVKNVNFRKQAQLVKRINNWVKRETHGKIKHVMESLNPNDVMVLLNAMYFNGLWERPFNPKLTTTCYFYNHGEESKRRKVPTMRSFDDNLFTEAHDFQALLLPYKGNGTDMLIIVPKSKRGLPNLVKSMTLEKLNEIRSSLLPMSVEVRLPKFSIQYSQPMIPPLIDLGWSSLLDQTVDLSRMTDVPNIAVSSFTHKTSIDVTEKGTEAAAVSSVVVATRMAPPLFRANKPFMFAIMNKRSGLILFMGQVTNL